MYILNVKVFGRFELRSLGSKPGELGRIWKGTSQICSHRRLLKAIFFLNIHICSWKMNWQRQLSCHLCRLPVLILDNRPAKRTKLHRSTFFFLGNLDFIVLDICSKPESGWKIAQKGENYLRLIEPQKFLPTPNVAQKLPRTIGLGLIRGP